MKFNVGLSKKVGMPDYGSLGASCHVEVELDNLLMGDQEKLREHVRRAYIACAQAVNDELARQRTATTNDSAEADSQSNGTNGHGKNGNGTSQPRNGNPRAATQSQIRALHAIAKEHGVNLTQFLRDGYKVRKPEELSIKQASEAIDQMRNSEN